MFFLYIGTLHERKSQSLCFPQFFYMLTEDWGLMGRQGQSETDGEETSMQSLSRKTFNFLLSRNYMFLL